MTKRVGKVSREVVSRCGLGFAKAAPIVVDNEAGEGVAAWSDDRGNGWAGTSLAAENTHVCFIY